MRDNEAVPIDRENAWPEWLKLQPGLTPVYTPALGHENSRLRLTAILGRAHGQPYLELKIYKRSRNGAWKPTRYGPSVSLAEFRELCLRLNDLLQKRPQLGEISSTRLGA
jgi:hypothetical protein